MLNVELLNKLNQLVLHNKISFIYSSINKSSLNFLLPVKTSRSSNLVLPEFIIQHS